MKPPICGRQAFAERPYNAEAIIRVAYTSWCLHLGRSSKGTEANMDALATETHISSTAVTPRRDELDWLRVLAVLGLIPFHVAIIFTVGGGDYVTNSRNSAVLGQLAAFVSFWGIPLLFLVAGASAWFALGTRTPRAYVVERFRRLVIPFLFGVLAIVPVQVYFGRMRDPHFHESYPAFYLRFLAAFRFENSAEYWAHLWFVPCLVLFAVISLPLFVWLRRPRGRQAVAYLARACQQPGVLLLGALPLGLADMVLGSRPVSTLVFSYLSLTNLNLFVYFLLFFIYGYLLYADQRFQHVIHVQGLLALVLAIACWALAHGLVAQYSQQDNVYSLDYVIATFLRGCISWFWILAIVSLALHSFQFSNRLLRYLDGAFYPIYVLHMPVLTMIGFYVVGWPIGIWPKYLIITAGTFVMTLAVYDLLIRRFNIARLLFGLKPKAATAGHGKALGSVQTPLT